MNDKHEKNRRLWNEITPVHVKSEFYDVPGFLDGKNTLDSIVLAEVGDVRGKSLLHLQCHFGLDSLSFARNGAQVTGVDFSEASIEKAKELASAAGLSDKARFICCDVLELNRHLDKKFDIVFTSYGVITWLSDLNAWARIVARFLKSDGFFFIAELHPFCLMFREDAEPFEVVYDYFHTPEGVEIPPSSDYADSSFVPTQAEHYWAWSLEDIFSALSDADLEVRDFKEYPFSIFKQFPSMEKQADGFWHLPKGVPRVPLLFSLKARHTM
ncbi:class I SAM-dependent methyltransferase [bacterium]|nr:class I SAM-dependent methyltransferase [bacterium]